MNKIDNRGYTTGFLLGTEGFTREEFSTSKAVSDWEFVGEVVGIKNFPLPEHTCPVGREGRRGVGVKTRKQLIYIKPHNALNAGEAVELITPTNTYKIKFKEFFDKKHKSVNKIRGGTKEKYFVELPTEMEVKWGLLRKK